jgi:predicted CXXCH cytochrome family protein
MLLLWMIAPASTQDRKQVDPAAWGASHAGKPIPEFVGGDECLFCHRNDIGPTWQSNSHGITVRKRETATELRELLASQKALSGVAAEVEYFIGSRRRIRFVKKAGYGKFALLSTQAALSGPGKLDRLINPDKPVWDKDRFADRCAGCHTTAVDHASRTFSTFGLDCYTCHGNVDLNHTEDTSLIWLSKKRRSDAKAVTSICAQCHLRGGKSRSTGLPYPNNFIAGDNLFKDYQVDWSLADDPNLNAGDRHVWKNVRDVVMYGEESITCLSCHRVHGGSGLKHRRVLRGPVCAECHNAEGPLKVTKPFTVTSPLCEY